MATFQPLGKIELIHNVDIDISYTHQYYFTNSDAQDNFFSSKVYKTLANGTYQRKNINTIQVPYQADEIADCKYLRWQNPQYSSKWYYAFVTSIDYINPGTSQINYSLDVYQTYLFDMQWKQSFIEREHTARWTTDVGGNTVPVINTEPEGLEYGADYRILSETKLEQIENTGWLVIGATRLDTGVPRLIGVLPTSLIYVCVPVCTSQRKNAKYTLGSDTLMYPDEVLKLFATNTTLVNSMVSCVYYPIFPFYGVSGAWSNWSSSQPTCALTIDGPVTTLSLAGSTNKVIRFTGLFSASHDIIVPADLEDSSNIYSGFPNYTESKLLMFPYSFMELTTKRGDSMVVKMEYIDRGTSKVKIGAYGTISTVNKMVYAIRNYLSDLNGYNMYNAMPDNSNSSLPIIDDYTASYLQSNSNSIRVAQSNAKFTQDTIIDNAYRSYETGMAKRESNLVKGTMSAGAEGIGGILGTIVGLGVGSPGMMVGGAGGIGGAIASGVSNALDYEQSKKDLTTEYWNRYFSASTDYGNAVASVMAKKNDAQQIPPTAKSLGGDYLFNLANNSNALYLVRKTIYPEYANKLQNYFMQYGYKVNRLEVPNFYSRTSWNYIKMTEPNVYGNIPMDDLMQIRDIFIRGITLWHGDYIGDYSRSNNER